MISLGSKLEPNDLEDGQPLRRLIRKNKVKKADSSSDSNNPVSNNIKISEINLIDTSREEGRDHGLGAKRYPRNATWKKESEILRIKAEDYKCEDLETLFTMK